MPDTNTRSSIIKLEGLTFNDGDTIPVDYTCDGKEISPAFLIKNIPTECESLVLIMEDQDAPNGPFTHWVFFNIPPDTERLEQEMPNTSPMIGLAGKNDAGTTGYFGPCPPSGIHRYVFTLYALDTELDLPSGASKQEVLSEMEGHILSQASLTGMYGRS